MRHLSELELVDLLDGTLPDARVAHLSACEACRRQSESLRDAVQRMTDTRDAVPEPSPLFWQHFSDRVREAVRDEAVAPAGFRWLGGAAVAWAAAIIVIVAVAAAFLRNTAPESNVSPAGTAALVQPERVAVPGEPGPDFATVDDDRDWALVRIVADELRWEDAPAAGIDAAPGSADRVALEMSSAERQELARLIETEIKRAGA